jgi:hypothetical protein
MSVAGIFNVPRTPEELNEWSFAHLANHLDIIRVLYQIFNVALPEYALDPVNPNDSGTWDRQHQQMHNDMNSLLGIAGFNLLGVEWNDENKLSAWIQLNAVEHRTASDILRLG